MARHHLFLFGAVVLLALLVTGAFVAYSNSIPHSGKNSMALTNFSICLRNCAKDPPYVSGSVLVNATTPLVTIQMMINGTKEFQANYADYGVGNYTVPFHANADNQTLPIIAGAQYLVTLVAVFQDNSTLSASTVVVAQNR
jgi:hypothetical protein